VAATRRAWQAGGQAEQQQQRASEMIDINCDLLLLVAPAVDPPLGIGRPANLAAASVAVAVAAAAAAQIS